MGSIMENNPGYYGKDSEYSFISRDLSKMVRERALKLFLVEPFITLMGDGWDCNIQSLSVTYALFQILCLIPNSSIGICTDDVSPIPNFGDVFTTSLLSIGSGVHDEYMKARITNNSIEWMIVRLNDFNSLDDVEKVLRICKEQSVKVILDISSISGLVCTRVTEFNPFESAEYVVTSVGPSLCGLQGEGAIIFHRSHIQEELQSVIFPGSQGTHHINTMTALGSIFQTCSLDGFKAYQSQVMKNTLHIHRVLIEKNYDVIEAKIDFPWVSVRSDDTAKMYSHFLSKGIIVQKSSKYIRIGPSWMTYRGWIEKNFDSIF